MKTGLHTCTFSSPIGALTVTADATGICSLQIGRDSNPGAEPAAHPLLQRLGEELTAFFNGTLRHFSLPLSPAGTPFQRSVWHALQDIPFGETRSYLQQARILGDEKAIRAVARANGANPIMILIPCHRIIGTDGSLTGYAGGLEAKQWLLAHEGRLCGRTVQSSLF